MDRWTVRALLLKSPDQYDSSSILLVCYQLWLCLGKLLGRVPNVPDQNLVKKFGPHRPSDGDSPQQKGGSDEVSLSFKGEQFQGFSVFASPAPPVRRKSSKDLK